MKLFKISQFFILAMLATLFVAQNISAQIEFVENKGQWNSQVKFMTHAGSGEFYLQQNGFTVAQSNPNDVENIKERRHNEALGLTTSQAAANKIRSHAYNVQFLNSKNPEIIPDKPIPSVNNYFIGNDPAKWASDCRIFQGITYKDVYPGIDVRYYSDAASNLKYDLIIYPGADINNIAMKYSGADKITVKNKQLIVSTSLGDNKELSPYTYQVVDSRRQELDCRYVVDKDVVRFKVKNYDPSKILIIDPTQIFFSFSASTADNWGFTATYGPDGSFYGGGIVFNQGFPVSTGAYDETFNGDFDIGIIKLIPSGKGRVYATYIGGKDADQPHSLIVDPQGNLVIAGRSKSADYPTYPSTVPKVIGPGGGWDIIVTKLNASGSALIGSMRIGGSRDDGVNVRDETSSGGASSLKRNYGDDARSEVLLDAANNIYVASCTQSIDYSETVTAGAFQSKMGGGSGQDGVVLKINPNCNSIIYNTFLGGSKDDAAYVLVLDPANNVYVAGGTASTDFPGISGSGVISSSNSGGVGDGFVVELNSTGTAAIKGTYLGTSGIDQVYGIDADKFGFIYVTGTTTGAWPVVQPAGAVSFFSVPNTKQFISKLKPDLSGYVYSTVFGAPGSTLPNISPTAFLVDRCENVYVAGWGGKSNTGFGEGNTMNMPTTPDAIKPKSDVSGSDFYFFVLKKDAATQLYGTFFGQEDPPEGVNNPLTFGDHVDGGTSRFDKNGVIYEAMCANCFRTVAFVGSPLGVWGPRDLAVGNNGQCNLGMLKIEMDFAGVRASVRASIDGVSYDTTGCVPLKADFADTLNKGKLYYWSFGDGTGDTTTSPNNSHVYNATGLYLVRLISIDSTTCNISDTAYTHIKAGDNKVLLDFIPNKIPPCTNLSYSFTNTSVPSKGSFNPDTFTWDFGDNSALVTASQSPPVQHTYSGPGTYIVKLSIDDTTFCNSPADTVKTVRLSPQVKAQFETPARGCVPYTAVFTNNSLGGLSFIWDFGDGSGTSTDDNPSHLYDKVGAFVVTLKAFDSSSCNQVDSATFTITVSPIPTASFTYNPNPPKENTFTNFVNQSTGATKYNWNFGDGDTSAETNPKHIFPATGTYNVCLNAANDAGCSADTCINVSSLIRPLVDVPSAFTPGKFGINGRISVVGFGITSMRWSIYNRWGQKVFESDNVKSSWDGTFKGKIQPLDVYAYTLEVTFSDGAKYRKTGDITLLR